MDDELIDEVLRALNAIPNTKYPGRHYKNTYELASAIERNRRGTHEQTEQLHPPRLA